jgi:hypothetical protein
MFEVIITASLCDDPLVELITKCNAARLPTLLSMLQEMSGQLQFARRN